MGILLANADTVQRTPAACSRGRPASQWNGIATNGGCHAQRRQERIQRQAEAQGRAHRRRLPTDAALLPSEPRRALGPRSTRNRAAATRAGRGAARPIRTFRRRAAGAPTSPDPTNSARPQLARAGIPGAATRRGTRPDRPRAERPDRAAPAASPALARSGQPCGACAMPAPTSFGSKPVWSFARLAEPNNWS